MHHINDIYNIFLLRRSKVCSFRKYKRHRVQCKKNKRILLFSGSKVEKKLDFVMLKELWLLVEVREQCSLLTLDLWSLKISSLGIIMYFKYLYASFFNSKKYEEPNHFLYYDLWSRLILVDNEIGHFFKCHKIPGGYESNMLRSE